MKIRLAPFLLLFSLAATPVSAQTYSITVVFEEDPGKSVTVGAFEREEVTYCSLNDLAEVFGLRVHENRETRELEVIRGNARLKVAAGNPYLVAYDQTGRRSLYQMPTETIHAAGAYFVPLGPLLPHVNRIAGHSAVYTPARRTVTVEGTSIPPEPEIPGIAIEPKANGLVFTREERCASAAGGSFQIEALAGYGLGNTIYELNALAPDPREAGLVVPIRSRLEFPMDTWLAGGRLTWRPGDLWSLSVRILANLNDPSRRMINGDFINDVEIIHTESDARLAFINGSAVLEYLLTESEKMAIGLLLRADYQRITEQVVGFEGWQVSLFSGQRFEISGTGHALDYRVTYMSPQLGGSITFRMGGAVALGLQGTGGIVFASDFDHHVLRDRTSEGSGTGVGLNAAVEVKLLPGSLPVGALSLALSGEASYYRAEGGMDQKFADGSQYQDIPYLFESLQGRVGLGASYSF